MSLDQKRFDHHTLHAGYNVTNVLYSATKAATGAGQESYGQAGRGEISRLAPFRS